MTDTDALIVNAALNKMFSSNHFSICDIDSICKVLKVPTGGDAYDRLRALHCMHWADMTPGLRDVVVDLIKQVIGDVPFQPALWKQPKERPFLAVQPKPKEASVLRFLRWSGN